MSNWYFGLLDMAIVGVPAIVFGIWQLVSVNRAIAKDRKPPPLPERARLPVGEHRLDDR